MRKQPKSTKSCHCLKFRINIPKKTPHSLVCLSLLKRHLASRVGLFLCLMYIYSPWLFFCANVNENKICTSDFDVIASYYYFLILGLPNTSGLLKRKGITAEKDADAVALMKEAGAIPIGLTNCSELCMWLESSNLVYGRCNNAYHQGRIVGGSSGKFSLVVYWCGRSFGLKMTVVH